MKLKFHLNSSSILSKTNQNKINANCFIDSWSTLITSQIKNLHMFEDPVGSKEDDKNKKSMRVSPLMAKSQITQRTTQNQPSDVFYKNDVYKNLAKFIGKHLCWSLFSIAVEASPDCLTVSTRMHR